MKFSSIHPWLAAIASGVLLVLSFPNFEWSWLAWVAFVPLFWTLTLPAQTLKKSFALGFVTGFVFFFFSCYWITNSMTNYGGINSAVGYLITGIFSALVALFPALFALFTMILVRRFGFHAIGLAPFIWVATEWLRATITGVTWNALGISQVNYFEASKLSMTGGVYLVSFAVIAGSAVLFLLSEFLSDALTRKIIAVYLMLGLVVYWIGLPQFSPTKIPRIGGEIKIAGVQPNLPVDILTQADAITLRNEGGLDINRKLTGSAIQTAENKSVDIIVWTESPLVLNYDEDEKTHQQINETAKEHKAHLIFSGVARNGEQIYNCVQTITPDGRALKRYDKMRLMPFGEYVPLRPILGYFVPAMIGDFTPGNSAVVNSVKLKTQLAVIQNEEETAGEVALERTTNFVKAGTFICYEAAYPNIVRQFVNNGASVLINISDDAWFGNSAGMLQHLSHARMRAIENDRDIVRVTNSGISALITAEGKVVEPLPGFTAGSHVWTAQQRKWKTFYVMYGDWFAYLSLVISLATVIFSLLKKPQSLAT